MVRVLIGGAWTQYPSIVFFMKIKIPLKLASEANSSEHWSKKSKRHKNQKFIVTAFMKTFECGQAPWVVKLTRFAPRPFDSDNAQMAFKYVRDAISEYLLDCKLAGRADSDPRISWEYAYEKTKDAEHYITIEVFPRDTPSQA